MHFWDEVEIKVEGGKGGNGLVSFARERINPKAGPDGGDGGDGGSVVFCSNKKIADLTFFSFHKFIKAPNGENGGKNRKKGKKGEDLIIEIPIGTQIFEFNKNNKKWVFLKDFKSEGEKLIVAKGGRGGWGNYHFLTSTHQSPRIALKGERGEKKRIKLVFKMIADVGLVGLPNSGKSTLLSVISNAKPKIADYPFTTLIPNLGVVEFENKFVVADIPGLIEGASQGKGLGDKFLKHIERTKILVVLIDATSPDPLKDYLTLINELKAYKISLLNKEQIIALTKIDIAGDVAQKIKILKLKSHKDVIPISSHTHKNISKLLKKIIFYLNSLKNS